MVDQEKGTGRAEREDSESDQAWKKRQRPHRRRNLAALSNAIVLGHIKSQELGALVYR